MVKSHDSALDLELKLRHATSDHHDTQTPASTVGFPQNRQAWFREARFGLFVHWGLYTLLGRGEWVMSRECIPGNEYRKLADDFTAEHYDPKAWAAMARDAGMKYAVLTAKHHEGFCLWDSKVCVFNAVHSAAKRDLFGEYVEAFRAAGLKVGVYYSLGDWHHPDWIKGTHGDEAATTRFMVYTADLIHELLTGYGDIDVLWYDLPQNFSVDQWRSLELNATARQLQPHILINNRAMTTEDFATPEQHANPSSPGRLWETCMTLNDSWGFCSSDRNYKSPREVVTTLATIAESTGNLLLNVGPDASGYVSDESQGIFQQVGKWLRVHGESIYASQRHEVNWNLWGPCTRRGNALYLHLMRYFGDTTLTIGALQNDIKEAELLTTGEPLRIKRLSEDRVRLHGLPAAAPDPLMPVVRLELDSPARQDFTKQLGTADAFPEFPR